MSKEITLTTEELIELDEAISLYSLTLCSGYIYRGLNVNEREVMRNKKKILKKIQTKLNHEQTTK